MRSRLLTSDEVSNDTTQHHKQDNKPQQKDKKDLTTVSSYDIISSTSKEKQRKEKVKIMKMLVYAIKLAQIDSKMKSATATDRAMLNIKLNDMVKAMAQDVATGKLTTDDYKELTKTVETMKNRG